MTPSNPKEVLAADRWAMAEGDAAAGPSIIRYREPVLGPEQTEGYPRCLRIVWGYAAEGSGAMPSADTTAALQAFEDRVVDALEQDALAVLTAVLTFDGARQWVFYTADVPACGQRIEALPQERDPYPIELDAFDDPGWHYLRDEILASVARDA
jgi:hypothetical protein